MNIISLGKCYKSYKYMYLASLFAFLTNYNFGYTYNESKDSFKFINTDSQKNLSKHVIYHYIFRFLSVFIISYFLYKRERKNNLQRDSNILANKEQKESSDLAINLIYQNSKKELNERLNISPSSVLIVITIIVVETILEDIYYKSNFRKLDLWMLELPLQSYLCCKILNFKIYKHHNIAIYFNLIFFTIFKIISYIIIVTSSNEIGNEKEKENKEDVYYIQNKHTGLIPIGIIFYLIIMIPRAYGITQLKVFMDLKFISPYKLLIYYGIIGTLISLIIGTFSTIFKCHKIGNMDMNLCRISNDNTTTTYFESFEIYWEMQESAKDVILEIFIFLLGILLNFLYIINFISTIKFLTPMHVIFSNLIYSFFLTSAGNIFIGGNETNNQRKVISYIEIALDIILVFGHLVYLEIIELNFWNYNFYLRENIIKRSSSEYKEYDLMDRESINAENDSIDTNNNIN